MGLFRPVDSSMEQGYCFFMMFNSQSEPLESYELPPMPGYRFLPPGEHLPTGRPTTRKGRAERRGLPPGRRSRYSEELVRKILDFRHEGLGVKEVVASGLCTYKELRNWRGNSDLGRKWRSAYRSWVLDCLEEAVFLSEPLFALDSEETVFARGQGGFIASWRKIAKRWERLPAQSRRRIVVQAIHGTGIHRKQAENR